MAIFFFPKHKLMFGKVGRDNQFFIYNFTLIGEYSFQTNVKSNEHSCFDMPNLA